MHVNQVNTAFGCKGVGVPENQPSTSGTSKSFNTTNSSQPHRSPGTQAEPNMQVYVDVCTCCWTLIVT